MAQPGKLTCQEAQELVQRMLDQRQGRPPAGDLRHHLDACPSCSPWNALLTFQPEAALGTLPATFSSRVARLAQRERGIRTWTFRGSMLAAAAAVILALYLGNQVIPNPEPTLAGPATAATSLPEVFQKVKKEVEQFPAYVQQVRAPSLDMLPAFLTFELAQNHDPIASSLPPFKSLGESLQGAVEPIEIPAKAAYKKVKEIVDDPQLRKWVESVRRGAV
jgi:hypothetical protein